MMFGSLFAYFVKEWRVILDAPVSFFGCVLVVGVIIYLLVEYIHRAKVGALEATVKLKDAAITDYQQRFADAGGANVVSAGRSGALTLEFGTGDEFRPVEHSQSGTITRTLRVLVKNTGDGYLTDCCVRIEQISPPLSQPKFLLKEGFDLMGGGRRFADFVYFHEKFPDGSSGQLIGIAIPPIPGWSSVIGFYHWKPHILTLKASSPDCRDCEASLEVVVKDGRLTATRL
jgi:hypothetical protein